MSLSVPHISCACYVAAVSAVHPADFSVNGDCVQMLNRYSKHAVDLRVRHFATAKKGAESHSVLVLVRAPLCHA